uniref:GAF domain-containing protein n=1 Tax=Anopheles melas TaxID=34690 RepID=A0A182TKR1_9DIPT
MVLTVFCNVSIGLRAPTHPNRAITSRMMPIAMSRFGGTKKCESMKFWKSSNRLPMATAIDRSIAATTCKRNATDHLDERFNREIDVQTGYRTKALLCMPIKDASGDVVGVAQVINKQGDQCFSTADEKKEVSAM